MVNITDLPGPVFVRSENGWRPPERYRGFGYITKVTVDGRDHGWVKSSSKVYFPETDVECTFPSEWVHEVYVVRERP